MYSPIDLKVFVLITDLGSISAAGRALVMPKSSVSRSLTRLEEQVGAPLIERSTRHLRLTDAGVLLQKHARRILNDILEAEDALNGLAGEARGDLRVIAPLMFAAGPVASIIPDLMRRYPRLRISVDVGDRSVDMIGEEYDISIRVGSLKDSGLIARKLTDITLWLCASADYLAGAAPIDGIADLGRHSLVSTGAGVEGWRFRDAGGALADHPLEAKVVLNEPGAVLSMVERGAGVALLPNFLITAGVAQGRLRRLLPGCDFGTVTAHALYPSHRSLSPKVRVFINALADLFREGAAACEVSQARAA